MKLVLEIALKTSRIYPITPMDSNSKGRFTDTCPDILVIDEAHGYSVFVEMLMKLYRDLHMKNKNIRLVITLQRSMQRILKSFFDFDIPEKTISGRQYPIVHEHKPGKDPCRNSAFSCMKEVRQSSVNQKMDTWVRIYWYFFLEKENQWNDYSDNISDHPDRGTFHAQVSPAEKAYALRKIQMKNRE